MEHCQSGPKNILIPLVCTEYGEGLVICLEARWDKAQCPMGWGGGAIAEGKLDETGDYKYVGRVLYVVEKRNCWRRRIMYYLDILGVSSKNARGTDSLDLPDGNSSSPEESCMAS